MDWRRGPLAPAQPATPADRYLGPDRDQASTAYVDFITSVHAASRDGAARIGVPWETALENGQRRYRDARTVEDVHYALLSVQFTLRDGHGRFARNELPVTFGPAVVLGVDPDRPEGP